MTGNYKKPAFQMLFLIATPKLVDKAVDLFQTENVPAQYITHSQGTASNEVMDMLGLDGVDKRILMSMMPRIVVPEILTKLQKKLHLGMPNTGIAFTVTMSGGSGRVLQLIETLIPEEKRALLEREESEAMENEYSMVLAIVNQGFSENVMNAARPMGASGGTVFHSRRVGSEEATRFWKISVQQEREVVIILAKKDDKLPIMQAISKECGMQSKAQGIVFSLPVDGTVGLD